MTVVEHLLSEAMKLTGVERAELAHRLLQTVTTEEVHAVDPDVDRAWREEARQRSARLHAGEVTTTPWDLARREVFGR